MATPPTDADTGSAWPRRLACGLALLLYLGLTIGYGQGLRGTDQYWYVADIQTLTLGGPATTNTVFPATITSGTALPPPFIHHGVAMYLALPFALLLGAHPGLVAFNVLCGGLAALLAALAARRLSAAPGAGSLTFVLFLLLPLTTWLSSQPLMDPFLGLLVAIMAFLASRAGQKPWSWLLLALVAGFAAQHRVNLLPVALGLPLMYLGVNRPVRLPKAGVALLMLLLALALVKLKGLLFAHGVRAPLASLLNISLNPREMVTDNGLYGYMHVYFDIRHLPVEWMKVAGKAASNLGVQLWPGGFSAGLMMWLFNLLLLPALLLAGWRRQAQARPLWWLLLLLLAAHLVTICLFQNQFRYQIHVMAALVPAAVAALAVARPGILRSRKAVTVLLTVVILVLGAVNAAGVAEKRHEAARHVQARQAMAEVASHLPGDASLAVEYPAVPQFLLVGYALRPRLCLYLPKGYTRQEYGLLLSRARATHLLARQGSPLTGQLPAAATEVARDFPPPYQDCVLYRLTLAP